MTFFAPPHCLPQPLNNFHSSHCRQCGSLHLKPLLWNYAPRWGTQEIFEKITLQLLKKSRFLAKARVDLWNINQTKSILQNKYDNKYFLCKLQSIGEKWAITNRQRSHSSTVENVKAFISIWGKTKTKYTSIYWLVISSYNIKSYIIR